VSRFADNPPQLVGPLGRNVASSTWLVEMLVGADAIGASSRCSAH
jgi:hypothetical protein